MGNVLGIIPARMGSSRFPGKPLAPILGIPMIWRVYENARLAGLLDHLYVATCDEQIYNYVLSRGGNAVMTSASHDRASDRCAEALARLTPELGTVEIVVMIQGDEPLVTGTMIDEAVLPMLNDPSINVVNLLGRINSNLEQADPNCIKVVVDRSGDALYFSRSPIPFVRDSDFDSSPVGKQICVIPFRASYLETYGAMAATPLEHIESIDMLRILENGQKVRMVHTEGRVQAVDTPADLALVEEILRSRSHGT